MICRKGLPKYAHIMPSYRRSSAWPSSYSSITDEEEEVDDGNNHHHHNYYNNYHHHHSFDTDNKKSKAEYRKAGLGFTIDASVYPPADELNEACWHHLSRDAHQPHNNNNNTNSASHSLEALFEQRHGPAVGPHYIEELQQELESKVGLGWDFERYRGAHSVQGIVRSSVLEAAVIARPAQRTIELSLFAVRPCASRLNLAELLVYQLAVTCVQHHCSLVLPYGNPAVERCLNLIGGGVKHATKNAKVFKPSELPNVLSELSLKESIVASSPDLLLRKRIWYFLPYRANWVADILMAWWAYEDRRHHHGKGPLTWFNQISTLLEGIQPMRCCKGLQYNSWYAMPIHHAAAHLLRALGDRICVVLDRSHHHDDDNEADERGEDYFLKFGIDDIAYIFRNDDNQQSQQEERGGLPRIVGRDELEQGVLSPKYRIFTRAESARVVCIDEPPPIIMPAAVDDWQAAIDIFFKKALY